MAARRAARDADRDGSGRRVGALPTAVARGAPAGPRFAPVVACASLASPPVRQTRLACERSHELLDALGRDQPGPLAAALDPHEPIQPRDIVWTMPLREVHSQPKPPQSPPAPTRMPHPDLPSKLVPIEVRRTAEIRSRRDLSALEQPSASRALGLDHERRGTEARPHPGVGQEKQQRREVGARGGQPHPATRNTTGSASEDERETSGCSGAHRRQPELISRATSHPRERTDREGPERPDLDGHREEVGAAGREGRPVRTGARRWGCRRQAARCGPAGGDPRCRRC